MKKKTNLLIILLIILSFVPTQQALQQTTQNSTSFHQETYEDETIKNQNSEHLKKLEWTAPPNKTPGTLSDYLKKHPYTQAQFNTPDPTHQTSYLANNQVALLVDETLYPKILTNLDQYILDLETENNTVILSTVKGGTPQNIKNWVITQYTQGCSCFVFIGDITAAWAEVSGDVFPSDLYYMDLDGDWQDTDQDGDFDTHTAGTGDMGPEVYIGRIYAHTLTYDTEANMVNEYLQKTHDYRTGELTQPWHGLEYVEEDWYDMDVYLRDVYNENVTRHDFGYLTTAQDYLNNLDLGHHFVQVCVHSYSGGHCFGTRPTEAAVYLHTYVHSPTTRSAKLLLGCDDGIKVWLNDNNIYTNDRYGGWTPDQYKIDVTLTEGWNKLLLKISQGGGDYKVSARFTDINLLTFPDLTYQLNDPSIHGGDPDFIRGWLLNGFHQDDPGNFWNYLTTNYLGVNEATIAPNPGDTMGGKTWTEYTSGYPFIDFTAYNQGDYGATYAFTRVFADSVKNCELWLGYDDGARVWLNSQEILYDNRYGSFEADMTKINITLQPGENRLLVKVSEWLGDHGFSARFSTADGNPVTGLSYTPTPPPISYLGLWLTNGPYMNDNTTTRLSTDYLGSEGNVAPNLGDPAPYDMWNCGIGNGRPFNIGAYYDHADWVESIDIQNRDPPVLFYNLFACGPGRFTDENFLAGAYIFHTTYGLITVASAKSGSMLNFHDFTEPLGQGLSIGDAFRIWFDAQAPYVQWEKEWYYGMMVFGDPTLRVIREDNPNTYLHIAKPDKALYIRDVRLFRFPVPLILGKLTVEVNAANTMYGVDHVDLYVDDTLIMNDTTFPYTFEWNNRMLLRHILKVVAYDNNGGSTSRELVVWKFF